MRLSGRTCVDCGNDAGYLRHYHQEVLCLNCNRQRLKVKKMDLAHNWHVSDICKKKSRALRVIEERNKIGKAAKYVLNDSELAHLERRA